jgi:hypothetical protein
MSSIDPKELEEMLSEDSCLEPLDDEICLEDIE